MHQFCSINGTLVTLDEAKISLANIEYQYGFGVYESLRVIDGIPYFLNAHIERLMSSARIIELDHSFDMQTVSGHVSELLKATESDRYNLKMLLIGATDPQDAQLVILPLNPRFPDKRWYKHGTEVTTYNYERIFPKAKTLNMMGSYIAYREAKKKNCYDSLLINSSGCTTEGTRTNFFAVKDDVVISPPEDEVLDGITRMIVLKLAKENGIPVEHQLIPLNNISEYDGAFLTSSSSKVMPIRKIDDVEFDGIPEITKKLMELFDAFHKECNGTIN